MKLIIDIPEAFYKNILICWENIHPKMWGILKNGIPYEERPQGKWIINTETRTMKCNRCGATENADRLLVDDMNFCYNCGADMRKRGDKK